MEQYPLSPIGEPGRVGDTSQKGNWSCFRNETLNFKTPFIVTTETDIPKKGILEFDFMSSRRPPTDVEHKPETIKVKELLTVLEKCLLMIESDRWEAIRYLNKCRWDCNRVCLKPGTHIYVYMYTFGDVFIEMYTYIDINLYTHIHRFHNLWYLLA
jgi:hypothetical protein